MKDSVETPSKAAILFVLILFSAVESVEDINGLVNIPRKSSVTSLCAQLIEPSGFPCSEHTTQTKDGYILGLQRVSSRGGALKEQKGHPVILVHGLFMAGDAFFLDSVDQSLGFILADRGFDVWVANVRGTRWSPGHVSLSEDDKEFWEWSWQELALYDLAEIICYVNLITNSKVFIVGHSQGTIISLAAFTKPDIVKMVEAAAFLCPISYLDHLSAPLVLRLVQMRIDEVILALGIHQLNFKSAIGLSILDMMCDGHLDCIDMLSSITGKNCCFNESRALFYLEYEPHPSSTRNLNHLFQMIRKGTFAMYDYGIWNNFKNYGKLKPPSFDLSKIPSTLPLWMGYGGTDALADVIDVEHTVKELKSTPQLLYLDNYGHIDFLLSTSCRVDVYNNMTSFFNSLGKHSSF